MKKILYTLLLFIISIQGFAQTEEVEMADAMRTNGKIYVVVGIILIVLIGFIVYLIAIDRKITRLEKGNKK